MSSYGGKWSPEAMVSVKRQPATIIMAGSVNTYHHVTGAKIQQPRLTSQRRPDNRAGRAYRDAVRRQLR